MTYDAGADFGVNHRLTLSGDFIGQSLLDASMIKATTFTDFDGNVLSNITSSKGTINQENLAAGLKFSPIGKLLVTANVLFRLNEAGLHAKPTPLIGVSYTF